MPYTKTNWVAGVTAWSAANFNNLETQHAQALADQTKEFFVNPSHVTGGAWNAKGFFAVIDCLAAADSAYFSFKIPHDFTAITNAEIIVIPLVTDAAANWDIFSNIASVGEAYNTHTEQDAVTTYNVILNQLFAVDISGILTNIVANDYVGVLFQLGDAADDVAVVGLRFKYS